MQPVWIIERKRDGAELSASEIEFFISHYADGSIPDYQMSALAMAIYFRGMNQVEICNLTAAMLKSGDTLNSRSRGRPSVDKHSTGGVGDKVSLALAPLAAVCGLNVPMISGRGLGITGGTLDKLEAIPGYRTRLQPQEFLKIVETCGCSIAGATARLAPADAKLYALRDVTATVPSIALITASILSKKLAEGLDGLVLDVKFGRGAFMREINKARELAVMMQSVAAAMGCPTVALLTSMHQPLGHAVGNALELIEIIDTLKGGGPSDLYLLLEESAIEMLLLGKICAQRQQAQAKIRAAISGGAAFECFLKMVELHGGKLEYITDPQLLPRASIIQEIRADVSGLLDLVDAEAIGRACVLLGAGRSRSDDLIDHAVGISELKKSGASVQQGDILALVHANDPAKLTEARKLLRSAFVIREHGSTQPQSTDQHLNLIAERIGASEC